VKHPRDDSLREIGQGYSLVSVGITFALVLTGAALLGFWLDRRLGTIPLFTLIGTLGGTGLGGFWVYQRMRRDDAEHRRKE